MGDLGSTPTTKVLLPLMTNMVPQVASGDAASHITHTK